MVALTRNNPINTRTLQDVVSLPAEIDYYYQGALVELDLSTGRVRPLGVSTGAAVYVGIVSHEREVTAAGQTIPINIGSVTLGDPDGVTIAGLTGQAQVGQEVYSSTDNPSDATLTKSGVPIGTVASFVSAGIGTIRLYPWGRVRRSFRIRSTLPGSAVTNTATETALWSVSVPANLLRVGDRLRVVHGGIAPATNSTDTLTIRTKIGSTAIIASPAVDVANDDVWHHEADITVTAVGAAGAVRVMGRGDGPDASGTAALAKAAPAAVISVDTTAAIVLSGTAQWSVANAGNSCNATQWIVDLFPIDADN